jgi:hypothetical protein
LIRVCFHKLGVRIFFAAFIASYLNMFYKDVETLPKASFKRLTGVKKEVFAQMLSCLDDYRSSHRKHPTRGKPPKLCNADKLLLTLMYYREYRSQFHIAVAYGISESRVCEIIRGTEDVLIADKRFHLPGKKELLRGGDAFEVVLIDVTESPVERPKKNSAFTTLGKRNTTAKRPK